MPFLFDGYNVYHAACKLGEQWVSIVPIALCGLIAEDMQRLRDHGVIVFDGRIPRGRPERVDPEGYVRIVYSGVSSDADSEIEYLIKKNTAPRRLVVVSSDRRIRQAARRRRARSLSAVEYLMEMINRANRPVRRSKEPPEKRSGLIEGDVDMWLNIFGIDDK